MKPTSGMKKQMKKMSDPGEPDADDKKKTKKK